jgi:PTS system fructose-specific IIA component/PTS system nitrogen regulatory IIA component
VKFADFIVPAAVRPELAATDKEAAIREMLQALANAGALEADVLEAILRREELGSTGIGRGVAVPHAKHDGLAGLAGLVAVSAEGIDFQSLDGEKVHIFFLLISPSGRPSDHLKALEYISRQVRSDVFCRFLRQAKGPDDLRRVLDEADNHQFGL